jgi:hypothetical protein
MGVPKYLSIGSFSIVGVPLTLSVNPGYQYRESSHILWKIELQHGRRLLGRKETGEPGAGVGLSASSPEAAAFFFFW